MGVEPVSIKPDAANNLGKTTLSGAAFSGAVSESSDPELVAMDASLRRLIEAWPRLSAEVKGQLLAMVDAAEGG